MAKKPAKFGSGGTVKDRSKKDAELRDDLRLTQSGVDRAKYFEGTYDAQAKINRERMKGPRSGRPYANKDEQKSFEDYARSAESGNLKAGKDAKETLGKLTGAPAKVPSKDEMKAMAKGGSIKSKKGTTMKKMASGGSFRSSANGIAKKGKTKGKQVKMAGGGMTKGCK